MDIFFRLVDDLEELAIITKEKFDKENFQFSGFFNFRFGVHEEGGYYHENPIGIGECGGELINYWLNALLDVAILFKENNTDYVAFKEIETTKKWIEFRKSGDNIILNIAIDNDETISDLLITFPFNEFSYVEPRNTIVEFIEFECTLLNSVNRFLKEIQDLNPELYETKKSKEIIYKLRKIKN